MLRIQRTITERLHSVHIAHFLQILIVPDLDLLQLVRGAETVEEVEERHAALDSGEVRHRGEIHYFLRVGLAGHRKTGLAAGIHVGMLTENVQRVGRHVTGGHVEHARKQLTGDLVHIRDHQQQTLRSGKGGGQRTGAERTVHRTGGACFRFHLAHLHFGAEDVFQTGRGPLIHVVGHRAGRGDRVDTRHFGKRIGYVCGRVVTVHCFELSCHLVFPP